MFQYIGGGGWCKTLRSCNRGWCNKLMWCNRACNSCNRAYNSCTKLRSWWYDKLRSTAAFRSVIHTQTQT